MGILDELNKNLGTTNNYLEVVIEQLSLMHEDFKECFRELDKNRENDKC